MPTRLRYSVLLILTLAQSAQGGDDIRELLARINRADAKSPGTPAIGEAQRQLVQLGMPALPSVLQAMDTPNIVAANWYRTIFDDIVANEFAKPEPSWPMSDFVAFVESTQRQGRARRLVMELLERIQSGYREKVLPALLEDPEFRQDAVEITLRSGDVAAQNGRRDQARDLYRKAFLHARESSQVLQAAKKLQEAGEAADPVRHLGFITRWLLIGPFDAPGLSGFDTEFPPERKLDLEASYPGQGGTNVTWKPYKTPDALGEVNLITALGPTREAVAFATAEISVTESRQAQIRCSADDNIQVWLNGERVVSRRQWLNGTRLDRFIQPVTLNPGINRLLVKICQGPQHVNPDVPNNWSFQLRLCDDSGAAINMESANEQEGKE